MNVIKQSRWSPVPEKIKLPGSCDPTYIQHFSKVFYRYFPAA